MNAIVVHVADNEPLPVATQALADAIRKEWQGLSDKRQWQRAPLSVLARRAHGITAQQRRQMIATISQYLCHERICYREARHTPLGGKQHEAWHEPLLWFCQRYLINLQLNVEGSSSMMGAVAKQQDTQAIESFINRYDNCLLTVLYDMTATSGSLVLPLNFMETNMTLDTFYDAATLEERHQLATWGADASLEAQLATLKEQWRVLSDFVRLCLT